jgi:hypothetical protein
LCEYRNCTRRRQSRPGRRPRSAGGTNARNGHAAGEHEYAIVCSRRTGTTGPTRRRNRISDSATSGNSAGASKRGNACASNASTSSSTRCRTARVRRTTAVGDGDSLWYDGAGTNQSASGNDHAGNTATSDDCRVNDFKFGE